MKNQDRLQELNNCLLKKSFLVNYSHFYEHLAEKFDVIHYSERSFNRDIKELRDMVSIRFPHLEIEYGHLIKYSRSSNQFYFVRDDISAFPGFSEKELTQIANSIEHNKHLFTDGLGKGILQKLNAIGLENRLSRFHQDIKWPALQLIKDGERSGGQWLAVLLEKIYMQEVIELEHKGLKKSSGVKKIKALPLMIKEYNNGWYTGWYILFYPIQGESKLIRPQVNDLWCFALDRIVGIVNVPNVYQIRISADFNPGAYFENIMGIYRPSSNLYELTHIIIQIDKNSWIINYIEKYPIHSSQELIENVDSIELSLRMEINVELENFLKRYKDEFKIIHPKDLTNFYLP